MRDGVLIVEEEEEGEEGGEEGEQDIFDKINAVYFYHKKLK